MFPDGAQKYLDRYDELEWLHMWVAINYVLLSVTFILILVVVLRMLERGAHKRMPWPKWWIKIARLVIGAMIFGTAAFLFGCGVHHGHMSLVVLPQMVENFEVFVPKIGLDGVKRSSIVGDEHYPTHVLLQWAQGIGGTWLLSGGLTLFIATRAANKRERQNGGRRSWPTPLP